MSVKEIQSRCEGSLSHPRFIDPLYRPYHTDYSKSPWIHPYAIPTGYPLVDPYRRHLGWGNNYRSQHEGYCHPGWRVGKHNQCIELEPESWGMFYTDEYSKPLLKYSNCKIPYNQDLCNPHDIAISSGFDEKNRTSVARCISDPNNFW